MEGLVAMEVLGGGASCRLYISLVAVSWVGMLVAYVMRGGYPGDWSVVVVVHSCDGVVFGAHYVAEFAE